MAQTVGKRLRDLREKAGFDGHGGQKRFAKAAGIPQSTISDIENERIGMPGGEKLGKLARVLRVHPDALIREGTSVSAAPPTPEEADLLGIFARLEPGSRAALMAAARAMLSTQDDDDTPKQSTSRSFIHPRRHS